MNNKFIKIAIVFVVILVVVSTALYFLLPRLMIQYPTAPPVTQQSQDTSELIPRDRTKSTLITQEMKLWKRYVTDNLSFSYPPEWRIETAQPNNILLYTPDLLEPPKGAPISVSRNTQQKYEDLLVSIRSIITNTTEKPITSKNLTGIELSGTILAPVVGQVNIFVSILNDAGNAVYVEYTEYPGGQDYKGVYQEIVKSIEV